MPAFSVSPDVAAGGVLANARAGSAFEFLSRDSRVIIAMTAEVAYEMTATIQYGSEVQLEEGVVPVEVAAGQGPHFPDDVIVDEVGAAGDRLVIRLTNAGAAAGHCNIKVRVIPIA